MEAALKGIKISPVNMENRKEIGIKAGDTVRVHQKIQDKGKTRIQVFEGLVLACKHGSEPGATFTVRKMVGGIGVEKIFPLYSPVIDKVEIIRRSKVRRAKLYYIREKVAREIKRQMRRMRLVDIASESEAEAAIREEAKAKQAEEEATAKAEADAKEAETATVEAEEKEEPETEAKQSITQSEESDSEADKEKEVEPEAESTKPDSDESSGADKETPIEESKEEVEEEKKEA